jgi:hypothetical protein
MALVVIGIEGFAGHPIASVSASVGVRHPACKIVGCTPLEKHLEAARPAAREFIQAGYKGGMNTAPLTIRGSYSGRNKRSRS